MTPGVNGTSAVTSGDYVLLWGQHINEYTSLMGEAVHVWVLCSFSFKLSALMEAEVPPQEELRAFSGAF